MYWQNTHCLCSPVVRLVEQLLRTKAKARRMLPNTYTQGARQRLAHTYDTLRVWRYDKAEWNLLITPLLLLLTHLFVLVSDTHTYLLLLPCGLIHLPALLVGASCFSGDATSDQWAAVRTVRERGGNSPPISLSLYLGTGAASGRGPQPPAVWMNTKQKLSPTGELHESMLVFL